MGRYLTLKPFKMTGVGGVKMLIPPGRIVDVTLKSDAQSGLASGELTKDLTRRAEVRGVEESKLDSTRGGRPAREQLTPDQVTEVSELSKQTGLPIENCIVMVQRSMREQGGSWERGLREVRRRRGLMTDGELLEEFAQSSARPVEEAQVEVYQVAEAIREGVPRAIRLLKIAAEKGWTLETVVEKFEALIGQGTMTALQVEGALSGEPAEGGKASEEEIQGEEKEETPEEGDRVIVVNSASPLYGKRGTIARILGEGQSKLAMDDDKKGRLRSAPLADLQKLAPSEEY